MKIYNILFLIIALMMPTLGAITQHSHYPSHHQNFRRIPSHLNHFANQRMHSRRRPHSMRTHRGWGRNSFSSIPHSAKRIQRLNRRRNFLRRRAMHRRMRGNRRMRKLHRRRRRQKLKRTFKIKGSLNQVMRHMQAKMIKTRRFATQKRDDSGDDITIQDDGDNVTAVVDGEHVETQSPLVEFDETEINTNELDILKNRLNSLLEGAENGEVTISVEELTELRNDIVQIEESLGGVNGGDIAVGVNPENEANDEVHSDDTEDVQVSETNDSGDHTWVDEEVDGENTEDGDWTEEDGDWTEEDGDWNDETGDDFGDDENWGEFEGDDEVTDYADEWGPDEELENEDSFNDYDNGENDDIIDNSSNGDEHAAVETYSDEEEQREGDEETGDQVIDEANHIIDDNEYTDEPVHEEYTDEPVHDEYTDEPIHDEYNNDDHIDHSGDHSSDDYGDYPEEGDMPEPSADHQVDQSHHQLSHSEINKLHVVIEAIFANLKKGNESINLEGDPLSYDAESEPEKTDELYENLQAAASGNDNVKADFEKDVDFVKRVSEHIKEQQGSIIEYYGIQEDFDNAGDLTEGQSAKINEAKELFKKESDLMIENIDKIKTDYLEILELLNEVKEHTGDDKKTLVFNIYAKLPEKLQDIIISVEDLKFNAEEIEFIKDEILAVVLGAKKYKKRRFRNLRHQRRHNLI